MAPPRPPPELVGELVGEILLRFPPDAPACLVRASLVCKLWRRILSNPAFLRRYRELHRAPPILGFLYNHVVLNGGRFVPIVAPSPFPQLAFDYDDWCALDCRHGRVLFDILDERLNLVVWNHHRRPAGATGSPRSPTLTILRRCFVPCVAATTSTATVAHSLWYWWSSMVGGSILRAHLCSSEAGAWNASAHLGLWSLMPRKPSTLIGDDIYYLLTRGDRILRYNLGNNCLFTIQAPEAHVIGSAIVLLPMEDGSLGLASIRDNSRLCLWSRNVDPEGVAGWVRSRVIELVKLITTMPFGEAQVVGSAEGFSIIFVATDVGVFTIELKSGRQRKVDEHGHYHAIYPFKSFLHSRLYQ